MEGALIYSYWLMNAWVVSKKHYNTSFISSCHLPSNFKAGSLFRRVRAAQVANVERRVSVWNAQQLWIPASVCLFSLACSKAIWFITSLSLSNKNKNAYSPFVSLCSVGENKALLCMMCICTYIGKSLFHPCSKKGVTMQLGVIVIHWWCHKENQIDFRSTWFQSLKLDTNNWTKLQWPYSCLL